MGRYGLSLFQRQGKRFPKAAFPSQLLTMARTFTVNPLEGFLIIDSTGTVLSASTCYLVDGSKLSDHVWDSFESFSDSECFELAQSFGKKLSDVVVTAAKLPGES